jgi:hypothetical protein
LRNPTFKAKHANAQMGLIYLPQPNEGDTATLWP